MGHSTENSPKPSIEKPTFEWKEFFPDARLVYIRSLEEADLEVSRLDTLHPDVVVGLDLEWRSNDRKGEPEKRVALIQIGCEDTILLIQVSAMQAFPDKLRRYLESPQKVKVGVGIQYDCKKLFRDYQLSVRSCIDLSLLARSVDSRWKGPYKNPIGLSRLAETYLDRSLTKGLVTRSNWEAALSEPQLDYAANDCQSSLLICYKLIAREIVTEPPPEPDFYTFDVIKGVLRDAFDRPWFPLNPFYDPGPPPPRPIPKEMKDDEPATARRAGAKRKKD